MKRRARKESLRSVIAEVMEPYRGGPGATRLSLAVDLVVLFLIVISCALIPFELLYPEQRDLFIFIDCCIVSVFIIEYALRWYSAENRLLYPISIYAIIDLVAILPSLLIFASHWRLLRLVRGLRILRLLRLLRLIRLLKFIRHGYLLSRVILHTRINLSSFVHRYQLNRLAKLFMITSIIWIIGANVLHYTETTLLEYGMTSYVNGVVHEDHGYYNDYWQAYWNIIILLISGIEDKEPLTVLGRVEATAVLIAGIVVIGLLTGEIVAVFVRRLQRMGLVKELPPQKGLLNQHIVILGLNDHLDSIIHHINDAVRGHHFILVVHPRAESLRITDARNYRRVFALAGDPSDKRVLDKIDLEKAARVVILSSPADDDGQSADNHTLMVTIAAAVRPRDKTIPTAVEIIDNDNLHYAHILDDVEYLNGQKCCERLTSQAVLNPGITKIYDELLNFSVRDNELYIVNPPRDVIGKSFNEVQRYFLDFDDEEITVLGLERTVDEPEGPKRVYLPGLDHAARSVTVAPEDRLVIIAYDRPTFALIDEQGKWSSTYLSRC